VVIKFILKTRIHMLPTQTKYMERTCNIDAKGRVVRFVTGIFAITAGFILAILVTQGVLSSEPYWMLVTGSIIGGMFAMWEARAGWCVVRAIGIRTPL
jgi:hypothetical protein